MKKQSILCAVSLLAMQAASAQAQTAPATTPATDAKADGGQAVGLEDIVVTARRTEERLQNVPIAITALSSAALEQKQIVSAKELQTAIPSIRITPSNQGSDAIPAFQIRGLANGVVEYFADVPLRNTRPIAANLYDLASVQVLRGPQGTLFGENSTAGAILFTPKKPDGSLGGYVEAKYGNYNARELDFAVNFPSDVLKVRIAGQLVRRDGLIKNDAGPDLDSRHRDAFRASFLLTPTDWLENYTVVDYQQFDEQLIAPIVNGVGICPAQALACLYKNLLPTPFGLLPLPFGPFAATANPQDLSAQFAAQQARGVRRVSISSPNNTDGYLWGVSNSTSIHLGSVTLKNILGYRKDSADFAQDGDGLQARILDINYTDKTQQFTDELQLQGKLFDNRLSWILGGYYRHFNFFRYTDANIFLDLPPFIYGVNAGQVPPPPNISKSTNTGSTRAVFGQLSYDLGAVVTGLRATAGYRYSWDKRDQVLGQFVGSNTYGAGICGISPASPGFDAAACTRNPKDKFSDDNYTVSLEWQVNKGTLVYATTRKGYTSGGFNTAAVDPRFISFRPETYTDYETGVKSDLRFGDARARLNLSVFTGKYSNIQVTQTVVIGGQAQSITQNAASATIKGGEFEGSISPFKDLVFNGFASLTDAKYDTFIDNTTTPAVNFAGQSFARVPKWTYGFSANYSLPLPVSVGKISLGADYYHQGATTDNLQNPTAFSAVPAYGLWNAQLNWSGIGGRPVDLTFWVKNLTDKTYVVTAQDVRSQLLYSTATYGEPRTYGLTARFRFGK